MKNSTRIILIIIIIILMLLVAGSYTYCMVQKYAHAEYTDIQGTDKLVNFNQLFDYNSASINGAYGYKNDSPGSWHLWSWTQSNVAWVDLGVTISLDATHKYYLYSTLDTPRISIAIGTLRFGGSTIFTDANYTNEPIYFRLDNSPGYDVTFYIIDLSLMFGIGNEPNLQECKEYFTAEYYSYSTGTPMAYNGLDNYYQAINDVFSNYEYSLDRSALTTSTYGYNMFEDDSEFYYNNQNWYILGAVAMPLFTTLKSGTSMTIDFFLYTPNAADIVVCVASLDNNNQLLELSRTNYSYGTNGSLSFTLTDDVSTIVFYARDISTQQYFYLNTLVSTLNIKANQLDVAGAILSSYNSGYEYAVNLYDQGSARYEAIYNAGYYKGQQDGNAALTAMSYIEAAFITLGNIMNIEVFPKFTLGSFFLFPIIATLIFFVFKLVKGGGD